MCGHIISKGTHLYANIMYLRFYGRVEGTVSFTLLLYNIIDRPPMILCNLHGSKTDAVIIFLFSSFYRHQEGCKTHVKLHTVLLLVFI